MSAPITDADRAAAHEALTEKPITCDDMRPGISHDWICEDVAQAIADAREAERNACVAWVRDAEGDGVADDLAAARRPR